MTARQVKRAVLVCSAIAAPILLAACTRVAPTPAPSPVPTPSPAPEVGDVRELRRGLTQKEASAFLGDRACAPCHSDIAARHKDSHHARTLLALDPKIHGPYFAQRAKITDPVRQIEYGTIFQGGRAQMTLKGIDESGALPVDYVIGAGANAHTYFSVVEPGVWMDLRLSYYPKAGKWDFTPGQRPGNHVPFSPGKPQAGKRLTACLLCHVTALREEDGKPLIQGARLGVGCERCHGPGKAHVDAVNAGDMPAALKALENLKQASPKRITRICGFCHQDSTVAPPGVPHTENDLPRFQAAALERSACYLRSSNLSCVTCHDPHADADHSPKNDERACRVCHSAPKTVCPVNPKDKCVSCHMPAQAIAGVPFARYTNHWIKVWKNVAADTPRGESPTEDDER